MTYARVVILLRLCSSEQCLNPVLRTSIKTRNFVTFNKFLIHLGVHHTSNLQGLLANNEVIHWRLSPRVILIIDTRLKDNFLLAEYTTKEISISPTLSVFKVPLEVPQDWGTAHFTMEMCLIDPFFTKRRSPLEAESSRTKIVLFLTFNL
jgi:hypothetical protein